VEEKKEREIKESLDEAGPRFLVSSSPHIQEGKRIADIMRLVIIALVPATLFSVYLFGLRALLTIVISVGSAVLFEAAWQKIMKKPASVGNLSAALTGLLLALNLPSTSPWWMILIGTFFAVVIAKQFYGGLGYNIFNPALVGRVVLLIAFPVQMTAKWLAPSAWGLSAVTTATPLGRAREALLSTGHLDVHLTRQEVVDLLIGNRAGSLGEVSVVLLLAGGLFLIARKIITWHIPVMYIATVWAMTGIFHLANPARFADPSFHVITGGLFLGAFFMATDYVTSPINPVGKIVFGVGCGVVTVIIRLFGAYPEGVSFAILLMNAFTPLIDRYFKPAVFGARKMKAKAAA
jgi:Na+-translocating ferredoxin:NAD+ oxidoreductase subunit D